MEGFQPVQPMELSTLCSSSLGSLLKEDGWNDVLLSEMKEDYFGELEKKLTKEYKTKEIFPPWDLLFSAFNLTPFNNVKVVILGQDPYHDDGQAMGLSFSVPDGIAVPPSLKNMYKELTTDIPGFKTPDHGNLTKWTQQGVLLLNATLTVEAHSPNSHRAYGWQKFTDRVLKIISDESSTRIVFILWGLFAHKKEKLLDASRHTIIKTAHPSPLSFNKFSGCKCFSKANKALKSAGIKPVDWSL
ncbi:uracil-DNA glycosylase-like isoform X2 [Gigantopelta aegis]|uniref:uracil-DNA glycosylase-like isoform X2 n=1 Tax=Gigantopelta aegis TaxID=1735272 RepID=UPI001B889540|nr:uracil-DNA glycosylase-like isoform X2 [Gigantopelta aegis]